MSSLPQRETHKVSGWDNIKDYIEIGFYVLCLIALFGWMGHHVIFGWDRLPDGIKGAFWMLGFGVVALFVGERIASFRNKK